MNKNELIDAMASEADLPKAAAGRALDAAVAAITAELAKGGSVSLVGFGTFSVKPRAARDGRNPRTGETIKIAASNTPGFKAGKASKTRAILNDVKSWLGPRCEGALGRPFCI